jgi:hypothetical protein
MLDTRTSMAFLGGVLEDGSCRWPTRCADASLTVTGWHDVSTVKPHTPQEHASGHYLLLLPHGGCISLFLPKQQQSNLNGCKPPSADKIAI